MKRRNSHFIAVFSWEQTNKNTKLPQPWWKCHKLFWFSSNSFLHLLQCVLSLCWRLFAKEMLRSFINWRVCLSSLLNNKRNLWFLLFWKRKFFDMKFSSFLSIQSSSSLIKFLSINLTMKKMNVGKNSRTEICWKDLESI